MLFKGYLFSSGGKMRTCNKTVALGIEWHGQLWGTYLNRSQWWSMGSNGEQGSKDWFVSNLGNEEDSFAIKIGNTGGRGGLKWRWWQLQWLIIEVCIDYFGGDV